MASPYLPNTTGIEAGIVALAQTVQFTLTGGGTNFKLVKLGLLKDLTDDLPCCTVDIVKGSTTPGSSGGSNVGWRREEKPVFRVMSIVDYTDSTTAEKDIVIIRDAIIPVFIECVRLGNLSQGGALSPVPNVMQSVVVPNSEVYRTIPMSASTTYRVHWFFLEVTQQYSVTLSQS